MSINDKIKQNKADLQLLIDEGKRLAEKKPGYEWQGKCFIKFSNVFDDLAALSKDVMHGEVDGIHVKM